MSFTAKTKAHVTEQIMSQLQQGVRPWVKPFNGGGFTLPMRSIGKPYRGINILLLWMADKPNPFWMTWNQMQERGGKLNKGSKATKIVWSGYTEATEERDGYWSCKLYNVFNCGDMTGLDDKFYPKLGDYLNPDKPVAWVDASIKNTGVDLNEGDMACYVPSMDKVFMPKWEDFRSGIDYYSTLMHEVVHWTGHEQRLDRLDIKNKKGYAFEELVAEMGASFLMAHCNLEPTVREDHAQYISHWLEALSNDTDYVLSAASKAQQAVDLIIDMMKINNDGLEKIAS